MTDIADRLENNQGNGQEEMARILQFPTPGSKPRRLYVVPDEEEQYLPWSPLKERPSPEEIPDGHTLTVRCFHQILRRDKIIRINEQYGFCNQCLFDPENNPVCRGYQPVYLAVPKEKVFQEVPNPFELPLEECTELYFG